MKQTLLDIVQRVAEYSNAGSVNSIHDTRESEQIASIVKETYTDMILRREIPSSRGMIHLESMSDLTRPTFLIKPEEVFYFSNLKYVKPDGTYSEVYYKEDMDFVEDSLHLNPEDENVVSCRDMEGTLFNVRKDRQPSYYTVLRDKYIVFDSYDSSFEDTMQGDHALANGYFLPEFVMEDTFVPELSLQQFPVLVSRAKINADMELKEHFNQIEQDRGQKNWISVSPKGKSFERGATTWNNRTKNIRR